MDMFVLGFVVGFVACSVAVYLIMKYVERKLLAALARLEADAAEDQANTVVATVEFADNRYFCYNKETKQFICYGNTLAEIRENFLKRFPNGVLTLVSEDPSVLDQLEQQYLASKNTAI
jgi:hypothetical protein